MYSLQSGQKLKSLQCSQKDSLQKGENVSGQGWLEQKMLPLMLQGDLTQEDGEAYWKQICQISPEVSDGSEGGFMGEETSMGDPTLFQNLCPQQKTQSELETIKDSAAKVKNHRSFQEGDEVSVYDRGKILGIMGRNNCLVESDNGTKHTVRGF